jgi:hypothetical protein
MKADSARRGHLSGARRIFGFGHAGNGATLVRRDSLYHFNAEAGRRMNAAVGVDF